MASPTLSAAFGDIVESPTDRSSSSVGEIWESQESIATSACANIDILSFTFANLDQYDQDHPIFVDALNPSKSFSAQEVKLVVRRLIAGLKAGGMNEGDCVCLHAFNSIWYPLLWLAIIGARGIVFGINPSTPGLELQKHFTTTKTKIIITEISSCDVVRRAATSCGIDEGSLFVLAPVGAPLHGQIALESLLQHGEGDWAQSSQDEQSLSMSTAAYCLTSGTTGLPKAAKIPHSYFVSQCAMIEQRSAIRSYEARQLICLPIFHAFAAPLALLLPLRQGTTTYFLPRFEFGSFVRSVDSFQITSTAIVPSILTSLLKLENDSTALQSLRFVLCAGAPITAVLQSKLYRLLHPSATISQVWGATEVGWITTFDLSEKDESGSVGRLLPGVEMVLEASSAINDVNRGEALIKSPSVFTGYLYNDDATAEAFDSDSFYKTGDMVSIHGGKVFVEGRVKEIMKVNGWQVSPAEIEDVLLAHPQILDAAVNGIKHAGSDGLEVVRPRAYVVRKLPEGEEPVSEQQIVDYVASRMISYKRLSGGVVFVEGIPRNPTGKILRRLLGDQ